MGFVNNLENQVRDYLDGDYEVSEIDSIPSVENVSFKKKAKKIKLCAYSIDLRRSSDLLVKHHKQTSGKIHKAFLTITSKVIQQYGGKIRSFQGDSILAFWPVNFKGDTTNPIEAAMVTKWLLDIKFSKLFEVYEKLDFGIGIDWSEVFILRAGISRDANNNDLVFIGKCVNFATAIANEIRGPNHIGISLDIYSNLKDDCIHHYKEASDSDRLWNWQKVIKKNGKRFLRTNMWENGRVYWNGENHNCKITSYYMTLGS